ncbi:MAG: anti-sigma factor domain-containing protein [Verrucomicrobiales bacterium]
MKSEDANEELACLYAIGALKAEEARAFEQRLREEPALQAIAGGFRDSAALLAQTLPQVAPPADVRARVLESFAAYKENPDGIPGPLASVGASVLEAQRERSLAARSRSSLASLVPWAAAAVFAAMAYWQWQQAADVRHQLDAAVQDASVWAASAQQAADENAALNLAIQKAEAEMQTLTGEREHALAQARSIENESESLRRQVAELKDQNNLSNARVAVLGSLIKRKPEARAASVWSSERQSGVLVVENLPALPPGRDYQLWVLDPTKGAPISAGVFQVDGNGAARVEFTAVDQVNDPAQFAVTEEKKGGVPSPTLEKLVLSGK